MIGYPVSLKILNKLYRTKQNKKDYSHVPTVTVMVVAHNEEKVILSKLNNLLDLDYPTEKLEFLISSDNSTDSTNDIVRTFISNNPNRKIRLYEVKSRKGKTNAQNEAQKLVETDFLVMTDANSIFERKAIIELMATFCSEDIYYVCGRLDFINNDKSDISNAESGYWNSDLAIRQIESKIQTITAGNGAIYACRNDSYYDFDPIQSHDTSMPLYYALKKKRCVANHDAIAYEKAGEVVNDEFKRKVRMNRLILKHILPDIRIINVFRYKWFTYFYFGHRTCRYLLWISHFVLLITSFFIYEDSILFTVCLFGQMLFYLLAIIKAVFKTSNKYITYVYYYTVTIIAQWAGVYNVLTGKARPFWEKAESTR